jgi:transcriptional regulator with XRE-family HTH domain
MPKSEKTGSVELGRLIMSRRQTLGLRRRDLVDLTGLSYPYVSQIETGYRLPSDRAVRDLAAALQLDTADLFAAVPEERRSASAQTSPPSAPAGWFTNPAHLVASSHSSPARRMTSAEVVAAVVALLEQLAPEDRLDALAQVQRATVEGLLRHQAPDGTS